MLQLNPSEVHIFLAHEDLPSWPCAECGTASKLCDHQPERQWRHLDTCQYRTIVHAAASDVSAQAPSERRTARLTATSA
ncbi:MAG: transposase family protein [Bryobacteraceae bacterium]